MTIAELVSQDIAWMRGYLATMTADNWADNKLRLERQLDSLAEQIAKPAEGDTAELVSRLRKHNFGVTHPNLGHEAVSTIERLSKELEEARALLSSARSDATEAAARVAEEYDGEGLKGEGYYDQLGDAAKTQREITAAIRALKTEDGRG